MAAATPIATTLEVDVDTGKLKNAQSDSLVDKESDGGDATILSSVINLANVIMGVGVLALPLAFSQAGWFFGMLLCIGSAALAICSLHLLGESARRVNATSFYAV